MIYRVKAVPFKRKIKVVYSIISVLFAISSIVGMAFRRYGTIDYITNSILSILISIWLLMVLAIAAYFLLDTVEKNFFALNIDEINHPKVESFSLVTKKTLLLMAGMMLCWLPFIIAFLPGTAEYDGYCQIYNFYAGWYDTSHPVLSTWILGGVFYLGDWLWGMELGEILIVVLNTLLCSFSFSIGIVFAGLIHRGKRTELYLFLFYALHPLWSNWVHVLYKDTLSFPLFNLYMVYYLWFIIDFEGMKKQKWRMWYVGGLILLLCLMRHNNLYIILMTDIVLIIYTIKKRLNCTKLIVWIVPVCFAFLFNMILIPAMEIPIADSRYNIGV